MKNPFLFSACLLFGTQILAQSQTPQSPPPRVADFSVTPEGNGYRFNPIPPPLEQKAGAPPSFWSYYWEFGDGSFSFEERPLHHYERSGNYQQYLSATAHYDDGGKPKGKSNIMLAERTGSQPGGMPTVFDSLDLPIRMKAHRQARANEDLVCILSYRNLGNLNTDGRLHLFFNERRFNTTHFILDSARTHFNERLDGAVSQVLPTEASPAEAWTLLQLPKHTGSSIALTTELDAPNSSILQHLLSTARANYRTENIWRFDNLQPGENRNLFLAMRGTGNMLQDTNAFIYLEAVFAPFDPLIAPDRFVLEIEIVSSHDPNAIIVSDSRVNYRFLGSKKLDYKVQFQNNGEGPASTVEVKVEVPKGLDLNRMRPLEWYPKCPICPKPPTNRSCIDTALTKEGLVFTFRNIYLPGTNQKGVSKRDSTKGYVRYRIEAERNMPKRPFRSRAKITFDKNDPIFTNFTRTRFKVGTAPGLKMGYGFEPGFNTTDDPERGGTEGLQQLGYFFLGASLSPYKSWRVYPQIELLTGIRGRSPAQETTQSLVEEMDVMSSHPLLKLLKDTLILTTGTQSRSGFFSFETPFLLRKNFNSWFGAGLGASARILLENGETTTTHREDRINYAVMDNPNGVLEVVRSFSSQEMVSEIVPFNNRYFRYTSFADLTFGSVRSGLNLGIRGGAVFERKRKLAPFVQLSLELKL